MRDDLILKLSTLIETIPGFGLWTDMHDEALLLGLSDVPDRVYDLLRREVLKRFKSRPSIAELRDLAAALLPVAEYTPTLGAPRKAGTDEKTGAGRGVSGEEFSGTPPAHVRAVFDRLKADTLGGKTRGVAPEIAGEWGLEYDYGGGMVKRMPARLNRAEAERRQAENAAKYTHFQVRVYQVDRSGDLRAGVALMVGEAAR